jgi:hypothetical protein
MDKNLRNYVRVFPGFLDASLCKDVVEDLPNMQWNRAVFRNYNNDPITMPGEKERFEVHITDNNLGKTVPILKENIWNAIHLYVSGYNFHWWTGWHQFSLKFNVYNPTSIMSEHCDHIFNLFDGTRKGIPILSVVALLNNEFEGGEFVMFEDEVIPLNVGDVMIFPSLFLYPHKVTPITSGIRYSAVSWVW